MVDSFEQVASSGAEIGGDTHLTRPQSVIGETIAFVVLVFVGIHTAVSITPDGKMLVPYVLSFIGALGLISINLRRIKRAEINSLVILAVLLLVTALLTSVETGGYLRHLRSSAQLLYSVLIGYAMFIGLIAMGRERVENIFFWATVLLLVGTTLEILGPLRPVSDWFRFNFNSWYGYYEAPNRDILFYGGYRPKFFASEPSLLGLSIGVSLFLWLSAKRAFNALEVSLTLLVTGVAFYLVRSPNLFFGPVAFLLVVFWRGRDRSAFLNFVGKLSVAAYLAFVTLFPLMSLYVTVTFPNAPRYMKELSYFERIDAPFLMAADAVRTYPLFGIGVGDQDQMNQFAIKTLHDMNLQGFATIEQVFQFGVGVGNDFWQYWIVFGLAGGVTLAGILSHFFKTLRVPVNGIMVLGVTAGTFWQGIGGMSAPLPWFVLFVVAAASKLRSADNPTN